MITAIVLKPLQRKIRKPLLFSSPPQIINCQPLLLYLILMSKSPFILIPAHRGLRQIFPFPTPCYHTQNAQHQNSWKHHLFGFLGLLKKDRKDAPINYFYFVVTKTKNSCEHGRNEMGSPWPLNMVFYQAMYWKNYSNSATCVKFWNQTFLSKGQWTHGPTFCLSIDAKNQRTVALLLALCIQKNALRNIIWHSCLILGEMWYLFSRGS